MTGRGGKRETGRTSGSTYTKVIVSEHNHLRDGGKRHEYVVRKNGTGGQARGGQREKKKKCGPRAHRRGWRGRLFRTREESLCMKQLGTKAGGDVRNSLGGKEEKSFPKLDLVNIKGISSR